MYDRETFVLTEPTIQFGLWENLDTLTPADDPTSGTFWTPGGDFGYLRMGTIEIMIDDEAVEYLSGTPHEVVRKDLLIRRYVWRFTANQATMDNFSRLYNLLVEEGLFDFGWVGKNTPTRPYMGLLARGRNVAGGIYNASMWHGQVWTPSNRLSSSGTDYTDIAAEFQSFVHPDFATDPTTDTNDTKTYGMIWQQEAGS